MAKDKKGQDKAEYPKMLRIGDYTLNHRGQGTAKKVTVNNKDEEADARKKYTIIEDDDEVEDKKPAGWGNKNK